MERFDILDSDGNSLGYSASREEAHTKGLWHRTIHLWLTNSKGELLWQKRSMNKDTNPGLWDISVAGHISAGQSSLEAAQRECEEEVGISVDSNKLIKLFTNKGQFKDSTTLVIDSEFQDVYFYPIPISENLNIPNLDEVSELKFFPLDFLIKDLAEFQKVEHNEEYSKLYKLLSSSRNSRGEIPYSV